MGGFSFWRENQNYDLSSQNTPKYNVQSTHIYIRPHMLPFAKEVSVLIMKPKGVPYKLFGLKALERRLSKDSQKSDAINEASRIVQAGVNGEKKLTDIFEKYTFPFEHYIFHDLNLQSTGKFQIDTLFLSAQGVVVLEMKNIAGSIYFPKERRQLERTLDNGQADVFECPSVQLERNMMLLGDWLYARQLSVPIQGAVVFSSPRQKFENDREDLRVLFPYEVPGFLRNREKLLPSLNTAALSEVATMLVDAHSEYNPFPICPSYGINPKFIKTGVFCQVCGMVEMRRISRGWACVLCGYFSKDAHHQAIIDWFMLIGGTLTNRECRQFLHITDASVARRLLKGMKVSSQGANRGRIYWAELKDLDNYLV